jgi:hypothetical protein
MLQSSNSLSSRHHKTYPQFRQVSSQFQSEFLNLPFRQCVTTARLITLTAVLLEIHAFWMWRQCTVTEGTYGRTASVCRVKWSTLLALLYPYARRLISINQHGPTSHNVWIIQTPVSMTSCCVTWTVKRGSTNGQPQPNLHQCCSLRHVSALVKTHQQQLKIHKERQRNTIH